jgi:N-acetylglutamate synthase-like GNAT family acetyltransferase
VVTIRTFHNSDLAALAKVIREHFATAGLVTATNALQLDRFVCARLRFDPRQLLVAEDNQQIVGCCHWVPSGSGPDGGGNGAMIALLCVSTPTDRDAVAAQLLAAAEGDWRKESIDRVRAGATAADRSPYMGLLPHGAIAGIADQDRDTGRWLVAAGFTPSERLQVWEAPLNRWSVPFDRQLTQLRRTITIQRAPQAIEGPLADPLRRWFDQCAMASYEVAIYQAIDSRRRTVLAEVEYWLDDPEHGPSGEPAAILGRWQGAAPGSGELKLLLSESLRELATLQRSRVRICTRCEPTQQTWMQSLGFHPGPIGAAFNKRLTAAG